MARRGIGWLLGVVVGILALVGVLAAAFVAHTSVAETWIRATRRSGPPQSRRGEIGMKMAHYLSLKQATETGQDRGGDRS